MRFSHKHRFLLISNWRCGCSTMARHFAPYSEFEGKTKNAQCKKSFHGKPYSMIVHWPAHKIRTEFKRNGWNWNKYIKISTVRNPWARIVSLYHYGRRSEKVNPKNVRQKFTEFVKREVPRWQHGIRNRWNSYEMFHDKQGNRIVDYVVRLEHLQQDLEPIMKKHFPNIPPFDYTRKANSTDHKHYSWYYTPETRAIVARIFRWEIKKYKYQFEKPLLIKKKQHQLARGPVQEPAQKPAQEPAQAPVQEEPVLEPELEAEDEKPDDSEEFLSLDIVEVKT